MTLEQRRPFEFEATVRKDRKQVLGAIDFRTLVETRADFGLRRRERDAVRRSAAVETFRRIRDHKCWDEWPRLQCFGSGLKPALVVGGAEAEVKKRIEGKFKFDPYIHVNPSGMAHEQVCHQRHGGLCGKDEFHGPAEVLTKGMYKVLLQKYGETVAAVRKRLPILLKLSVPGSSAHAFAVDVIGAGDTVLLCRCNVADLEMTGVTKINGYPAISTSQLLLNTMLGESAKAGHALPHALQVDHLGFAIRRPANSFKGDVSAPVFEELLSLTEVAKTTKAKKLEPEPIKNFLGVTMRPPVKNNEDKQRGFVHSPAPKASPAPSRRDRAVDSDDDSTAEMHCERDCMQDIEDDDDDDDDDVASPSQSDEEHDPVAVPPPHPAPDDPTPPPSVMPPVPVLVPAPPVPVPVLIPTNGLQAWGRAPTGKAACCMCKDLIAEGDMRFDYRFRVGGPRRKVHARAECLRSLPMSDRATDLRKLMQFQAASGVDELACQTFENISQALTQDPASSSGGGGASSSV